MVCLGIPYHFRFLKGCPPQILLGQFLLNTMTHMNMLLFYFDLSDLKGYHSVNKDFHTEFTFINYNLNNTFHTRKFITGHLFISTRAESR